MPSYKVSPKYKKSVEEVEFLRGVEDKNKFASICTLWRSGSYVIHTENEEEEEMLKDLDDAFVFEVTEFENWELIETWDGCSEDVTFIRGFSDEKAEELHEQIEEEGWWDILIEREGMDSEDMEIFIHNGVIVEPWEGYETEV